MIGFDLVIVGAGIVGLAHAVAATRLGLRVAIIDRDAQANGASVRNFGFVTVTGQEQGQVWRRAKRSREVWASIAPKAQIDVIHQGLLMLAQRPEAMATLEAFMATDMAEPCRLLSSAEVRALYPNLNPAMLAGGMYSDIDLRVESRLAIPKLAAWLEAAHGVQFFRKEQVIAVETGKVVTTERAFAAKSVVVCPGDDMRSLFPAAFARRGITRCKLQMLRLEDPGFKLEASVMSDQSLVRYLGYSALDAAKPIKARLQAEQSEYLAHGIHLIVVQSQDGSLVVGDSHHYGDTPDPFGLERVDDLILQEFTAVFGIKSPRVLERWTGTYASGPDHSFVETPMDGVRVVCVTGGTGASTAFGLAEEVVSELYNTDLGAKE